MTFETSLIPPAVERYRRERDRYIKLADRIAEICRADICEENAIRAQVTFRIKSASSFEGKLRRFAKRADKSFQTVDEIFSEISDLAGVRIATYREEDCAAIVEAVAKTFCGADGNPVEIDEKDKHKTDSSNFYRATHAQVYLPEDELIGTYDNLSDVSCEIQICTMMAHVWNEIEHDIGYKPEAGGPSELEKYILKNLGQEVRKSDNTISSLLAAFEKRMDKAKGDFRDVHDFVARMRQEYDAVDFSKNSGQLFELTRGLGLANSANIKMAVGGQYNRDEASRTIEAFNRFLVEREDRSSLLMDLNSSDVLLIQLLQSKCQVILDSHKGKVGRGRGAPSRLYRLARRYAEFSNRGSQSPEVK